MPNRRVRDLRRYAESTQVRLILGGLVILFAVGGGLVWWIYGPAAATLMLACAGVGLAPAVLVVAWISLISWAARRAADE
jgi:cation transporter-like permease